MGLPLDDEAPTDPEAAARFWRATARDLNDELDDAKLALEELDTGGRELEKELELDLAETERRERALITQVERLKGDAEDAKTRYQTALRDHAKSLGLLQEALDASRKSEETLRIRVRDMELDNDTLENAERAMGSTLQDLESRYAAQLERTAMLEQELVVKAQLEEEAQRLKDELRDAAEELAVLRVQRASSMHGARPMTPPGAGHVLPASPQPPSTPSSTIASTDESTPRKASDLPTSVRRPMSMTMTPEVRTSPSKLPSPIVSRTSARPAENSLVTGMRQRNARILAQRTEAARTERGVFSAFGSSIPRPTSSVRSRRPSMMLQAGEESPIVAAQRRLPPPSSQPRRPPSRASLSMSLASGSRPTTPAPSDGRSPTPSSLRSSMMPASTPQRDLSRRKSTGIPRPSSALGRAPPPPLPTPTHVAFGRTIRAPSTLQQSVARRVSLGQSIISPPTMPAALKRASVQSP